MFKLVSYIRPQICVTKQPVVNCVIERFAIGKNLCYQQIKYRTHDRGHYAISNIITADEDLRKGTTPCRNFVLTNIVVTAADLKRNITDDTKFELRRTLNYLLTRDEFVIEYRKYINGSADIETMVYIENLLGAEKIISKLSGPCHDD